MIDSLNYSDEEIQKAVFSTYKIQLDVVTAHNGRVFDPVSPLDYFDKSIVLPKTRASSVNSDSVFTENIVSGLTNYETNDMIFKWSLDKVRRKTGIINFFYIIKLVYEMLTFRNFKFSE